MTKKRGCDSCPNNFISLQRLLSHNFQQYCMYSLAVKSLYSKEKINKNYGLNCKGFFELQWVLFKVMINWAF